MLEYFLDLHNLFPEVCHTRLYEKEKAKIISYWKDCFFSKICVFQQPPRCYRSDLITSTKVVGIPFAPLQIVPWALSHSITRGMWPKSFVTRKTAFFEKFGSRLLRSWSNDHIACKGLVKIPCVLISVVPWHLSCSILREKLGQNLFFTRKIAFLCKNLFSATSYDLKELIKLLPQYLSEYLVEPYKVLLEMGQTR